LNEHRYIADEKMVTQPHTRAEYHQGIALLLAELIPPEEQNSWILTSQSALSGQAPLLAMLHGKEDEVYKVLVRLKRGN
jgi:hypothetical protein